MTDKESEKPKRGFGSTSSGGDGLSRIGALGGNPTLHISQVKLDGNNYLSWSRACLLSIDAGLYDYVTGTLKEPTSIDPTVRQWWLINSLVMLWLLNSMQPHISRGFLFLKTAYEIWTVAVQTYSQDRSALATFSQKYFKAPQPRVENKGGNSEKGPMKCDYCGKRWHTRDNCWKLHGCPNTGRGAGKTRSGRLHAHLTEALDTPLASTKDANHLTSKELQVFRRIVARFDSSTSSSTTTSSHFADTDHCERLDRANLRTYVRARQARQDKQIDPYVPQGQSQSLTPAPLAPSSADDISNTSLDEERLRLIYTKKCKKLKALDDRGAEISKIDATQASIKRLLPKVNVAVSTVDVISRKTHKLRDEELQPQLNELIHGYQKRNAVPFDG
ncbi:hypothetical protein F0562_005835 [Nyssa sinensis]|uniref:DUF632 domain-containing protein n=1 Tax=Nyssa sinensis TaxID=561372 RepID=A0A5J5AN72_9ASTE|nr:hypothetical protein F0562_005835 [Nyssa sinensis]